MSKFLGWVVVLFLLYWAWSAGYVGQVLDYFNEYSRKPAKQEVKKQEVDRGYTSDRYRSGLDLMLGR